MSTAITQDTNNLNSSSPANSETASRPWLQAILWLAFLTPLFFSTYLGSLEIVSRYESVPVIIFDWEKYIPFWAWTIVPYWSIDLLYGISLFLCRDKRELKTHGLRLFTAQLIAIPIFLLWPLKLTSTIPADTGHFSFFFGALEELITKPFNLAPSLHIALLVILWDRYRKHCPNWLKWPMHIWAFLIGLSVLTANQHHFFDVPTGALLGFFCLWIWPEHGTPPLRKLEFAKSATHTKLGAIYALAGILLILIGWQLWGTFLWLIWPGISLIFVSAAYLVFGPELFQKSKNHSLAVRAMLAPYLIAARINSKLWTRSMEPMSHIANGVYIASHPSSHANSDSTSDLNTLKQLSAEPTTVLDLTAEMPSLEQAAKPNDNGTHVKTMLWLDLVVPQASQLAEAASFIQSSITESATKDSKVVVCCALGVSRSAAAVATWLVATNYCESSREALQLIQRQRPQVRLSEQCLDTIDIAANIKESVRS